MTQVIVVGGGIGAFLRACGAIPSLRRAAFGNRREEPA